MDLRNVRSLLIGGKPVARLMIGGRQAWAAEQTVRIWDDPAGILADGTPIGVMTMGTRIAYRRAEYMGGYYLGIDAHRSSSLPWTFRANDAMMDYASEYWGEDMNRYGRVYTCAAPEDYKDLPGMYLYAQFDNEQILEAIGIGFLNIDMVYGTEPTGLKYMTDSLYGFRYSFDGGGV